MKSSKGPKQLADVKGKSKSKKATAGSPTFTVTSSPTTVTLYTVRIIFILSHGLTSVSLSIPFGLILHSYLKPFGGLIDDDGLMTR